MSLYLPNEWDSAIIVYTKLKELLCMLCYAKALGFLFSGGPNMIQNDNVFVHKVRLLKTCFSKAGMKELEWPLQSSSLKFIDLKESEH